MLGALEVKRLTRLAAERGPAWKSIHTAVLSCLLAHRNHTTGHSWPARAAIAAYCRTSERTVDRAIASLVEWGAIEKQQPRALPDGQFQPLQYSFLFELPRATAVSPVAKKGRRRSPKKGAAGRQNRERNKERSFKSSSTKARGAAAAFVGSPERKALEGTFPTSSSATADDDVEVSKVLHAFEQSPITCGTSKPADRVTARKLLNLFPLEKIEYGILLAGARRVTMFLRLDVEGREHLQTKVQTLAYFSNAIEEAATDPNMGASYSEYLRHTLRKWARLQESKKLKGGAA